MFVENNRTTSRGDYLYCMSKKSWPLLCSNLLYTMGQDFLITYNHLLRWTKLAQILSIPKLYRKSVLHLLRHTANLYSSRCITYLRLYFGTLSIMKKEVHFKMMFTHFELHWIYIAGALEGHFLLMHLLWEYVSKLLLPQSKCRLVCLSFYSCDINCGIKFGRL